MKKIHAGLIGCGWISERHVLGYLANSDLVDVVAVCDTEKNRANEIAKRLGVKNIYEDYRQILDNADIDFVDITLPPYLHPEVTIAAAEAGKHILVEKPMAITVAECENMLKATKKARVKLMVGESYLFYPPVWRLKEIIDKGELGELLGIRMRLNGGFPVPTGPSVSGWRADTNKSGGGITFDWAWHFFAIARWYMGDFESVSAMMSRIDLKRPIKPYMSDEVAVVAWKHKGGPKYGVMDICFYGPVQRDERVEVTGIKGIGWITGSLARVLKEKNKIAPLIVYKETEAEYYSEPEQFTSTNEWLAKSSTISAVPFIEEIRHFTKCVMDDKEPLFSGEDGKRLVEICRAMYRSAEDGRTIQV